MCYHAHDHNLSETHADVSPFDSCLLPLASCRFPLTSYLLLLVSRPLQSGARLIDDSLPLKEQAVEAVLVRWQYSGLPWFPHGGAGAGAGAGSSSGAAAGGIPSGFVELKGFPGVYVGLREDVLGTIRDTRPAAPRPCKVSQKRRDETRMRTRMRPRMRMRGSRGRTGQRRRWQSQSLRLLYVQHLWKAAAFTNCFTCSFVRSSPCRST